MEIIPIHYNKSIPVNNWLAIEKEAKEMADFIDGGEYGEFKQGMFALHASQVNEKSFNYFVLNNKDIPEIVNDLGSRFIVNPKIEKINSLHMIRVMEGCVSFPYRKQKYVERALIVEVSYEIPDPTEPNGLKKVRKQVEQLVAQIFQHECDHGNGINIHYKSPK